MLSFLFGARVFVCLLIHLFPSFTEVWLTNKHYIYLRWRLCFDKYYEMITTTKLINTPISWYSYLLFIWWEHLRYTLSKFQVFNTLLLIMLYIRSPELMNFITEVIPSDQHLPFIPTCNHHFTEQLCLQYCNILLNKLNHASYGL